MSWDEIAKALTSGSLTERFNFFLLLVFAGISQSIVVAQQRTFGHVIQMIVLSVFVGSVIAPMLRENSDWGPDTVTGVSVILAFLGHWILTGLTEVARRMSNEPGQMLVSLIKRLINVK